MTKFLKDILRQPAELQRSLAHLTGPGRDDLDKTKSMLASATHVFLTGIGSSWHAALGAAAIFYEAGRPVYLVDAAELLHFGKIPAGSVVIMLSRTGRSIEIVRLLSQAHGNGAKVIGITNSAEGTLGQEADLSIVLDVLFDHGISVNTFSTLALAAGVLASIAAERFDDETACELSSAVTAADDQLAFWQEQVEQSSWLEPQAAYYFLGRGSSLCSAHEARLLWEEGVKHPATAMGTGSFRHGPQEIVDKGLRFGLWLDGRRMRDEDLAVARDLGRLGASVMLIGHNIPKSAGELVFDLPHMAPEWQYAIDAIPAQLLAERLSRLAGKDCDSFRFCSYIVEDEGGLLKEDGPVKE